MGSMLQISLSLIACVISLQTMSLAQPVSAPGLPVTPSSAAASAPSGPTPATLESAGTLVPQALTAGKNAAMTPAGLPYLPVPSAAPASSPESANLDILQQPCPSDYEPPHLPQAQCSTSYSIGIGNNTRPVANADSNSTPGCIWESWANYYDANETSNRNITAPTAQECCAACANSPEEGPDGCNAWNWCGNPTGCCIYQQGCNQNDGMDLLHSMYPYQLCSLKYIPKFAPDVAYKSDLAAYGYNASDVLVWPDWHDENGTASPSTCKSLTAGFALSWLNGAYAPTTPQGISLLGVSVPGLYDYGCDATTHPSKYLDKSQYCYIAGDIQNTTAVCLENDPSCSGMIQLQWQCEGQQVVVDGQKQCRSAYLKSFPEAYLQNWTSSGETYPDCSAIYPYASTILFPHRVALPGPPPSPDPPPTAPPNQNPSTPPPLPAAIASPSSGKSDAGPIAGGVVGGLAALGVLFLAAAFWSRKHAGRWSWPGTSKGQQESSERLRQQYAADSSAIQPYRAPLYDSAFADGQRGTASLKQKLRESDPSPGIGLNSQEWTRWDEDTIGSSSGNENMLPVDLNAATHMLNNIAMGQDHAEWGINLDDLSVLQNEKGEDTLLGAGAFGVVYKALWRGVDIVAVKVLRGKQDLRSQAQFLKEIELLKTARHPNVVMYLGACISQGRSFLVTEFMAGGDLFSQLRDHGDFTWYNRGRLAAIDVAHGLNYLHNHNTLHLDIKSGNVLLSRDGTAKISDVGLARIMRNSQYTRANAGGTWAWSAPEVILGQQVNKSADVFSFGVFLWEVATQQIPRRGSMRDIEVPEEAPLEIKVLVENCMHPDPKERPDMREVISILSSRSGSARVI